MTIISRNLNVITFFTWETDKRLEFYSGLQAASRDFLRRVQIKFKYNYFVTPMALIPTTTVPKRVDIGDVAGRKFLDEPYTER